MRATDGQDSVKYDVVVIGGGSAAITLGRALRETLLLESSPWS